MDDKQEQYNAHMREKVLCDKCNRYYTRYNKQKHLKGSTHKKNSNDKLDVESYLDDVNRKYDKRIKKISDERNNALREIDKQIINI